ncbi:MAG: 50S ribosomal protein L15 [Elusimicrobiota bacterium]
MKKEELISLNNLSPAPGAKKSKPRTGRGPASGKGRSAGRGRGGSGHRAGSTIKTAFEGGQMPLVRRLPKRGFSNKKFEKKVETVNVSQLSPKFKSGEKVTPQKLKEKGYIKGKGSVKILAKGDLNKKLNFAQCDYSSRAVEKIKAAGGTID